MPYARFVRVAALLGLAISLFLAASNACFVLAATRGWPSLDLTAGATTYFTFADSPTGKGVGLLALCFDATAAAVFWLALWHLGRRLAGPISDIRIARAFQRLAWAFGCFVLLRGLAIATLLAAYLALGGRARYSLELGHTALLLGALAGGIAWCVARLLAQASDLAAENAGFV